MSLFVTTPPKLITPHGDKLVDLIVPAESYEEVKAYASLLPSIQISPRAACDLELLATGAFSPLDHFMGREDYQHVLNEMRLADGIIFPLPITLSVSADPVLKLDQDIALRNSEYELVGIMTIEELYEWDHSELSEMVFGTQDLRHPMISELNKLGSLNVSGRLQVLNLPRHYDFPDFWLSPSQAREKLERIGHQNVIAFQPRSSWKQLHEGFAEMAAENFDASFLVQPVVGLTRLGDVEHYTRVRIYNTMIKKYYGSGQAILALLPFASRMAGPREALFQAVIHRNYGASHMVVRRGHANPTTGLSKAVEFYDQDAAQKISKKYSQELNVEMIPEGNWHDDNITDSPLHNLLVGILKDGSEYSNNGHSPSLNTQTESTGVLTDVFVPRHRQGVCIWFTGLSGSGKSTTAEMLTWLLMEHSRRVTVLDGDVVRTNLSKGLSFSKADRDTNVRRIGFVASELVRLGGIVICAVVSPYRGARNDVRNMMGIGQFVEVYVDTPLEVCETRDVKGFYAKARSGAIKGFTGIDDPYELPDHPEITLDTVNNTPGDNANLIIDYLIQQGFIRNS